MTQFSVQNMIFLFIGGLALILFGLRFMTDALQLVAGEPMRKILEKGTKTPVRGVFTGILVTALIQSSTATTVLTMGLVNTGLLSLRQAIGVIMGANIGTTITAYLIGFNFQAYSLPILSLGAVMFLFIKNRRVQLIGQALLGFGILFYGLSIMGEGVKPLKDLPSFLNLMTNIDKNALWGLLIGIGFTGVVQSSSATIGVLQQLAYQGAVTYQQSVPILFGDNLGTTITALIASLGTGVAARRTALTHFLFNLIGIVIWLPLFLIGVFPRLVELFTSFIFAIIPGLSGSWSTLNIKLQIAQTHAVFNIANTLILLPFITVLAWLVVKFIPERRDAEDEVGTVYIHKRFLETPGIALTQAMRETIRMGRLAARSFFNAIEYFNEHNPENKVRGVRLEETVNRLQREITDYVVLASEKRLSKEDSARSYLILQALSDLERISDHCQNIVEQADFAAQNQVTFSGEAHEELGQLIKLTDEALTKTIMVLDKGDNTLAREVIDLDKQIDSLQPECRKSHIRRLNERICNGSNGAVFLDVISHLGRISNHCRNIAWYVLDSENPT
ncbi:MAG: Na/Pi cotransporter family protein [Methylocystaceae bacterium]